MSGGGKKGNGELKNDPKPRRNTELGSLGDVAIVTMFATDELCPLLKTHEVDVLAVGHT